MSALTVLGATFIPTFRKVHSRLHKVVSRWPYLQYGLFALALSLASFFPFIMPAGAIIVSPFNGYEYLTWETIFSTWHSFYMGSYSSLLTPQILLAYSLYQVVPPEWAHVALYGGLRFIAGCTMYIFSALFTTKKATRFVIALFYVLSLYAQAVSFNSLSGGFLFYALLPAVLYLVFTLRRNRFFTHLGALAIFGIFLSDTNFTYHLFFFMLVSLYYFYSFIIFFRWQVLIKWVAVIMAYAIGLQVYFLPTVISTVIYEPSILSHNLQAETPYWKSMYSKPSEVFRLLGGLDLYDVNFGIRSKPFFTDVTSKPWLVLLSFIPVCIALLGFGLSRGDEEGKTHRCIRAWGVTSLGVLLFFGFGVHPSSPLQEDFLFLYSAVPLFSVFRDPYKAVLSIHIVYSIGVLFFFEYVSKKSRLLYTTIISFFVIVIFGLSVGQLQGKSFILSELLRIPAYWHQFAEWSADEGAQQKKVLLPSQPFLVHSFSSQRGKHSSFPSNMTNYTALFPQPGGSSQDLVYQLQKLLGTAVYSRALGFYSVPYSVLQKDVDFQLYGSLHPEYIEALLKAEGKPVKTFGERQEIQVYAVPETELTPLISFPERVRVFPADSSTTDLEILLLEEPDNSVVFMSSDQVSLLGKTASQSAEVEFKRIASDLYQLTLSGVEQPSVLVFNEAFHAGWKLKKSPWSVGFLAVEHHAVSGGVNGFIVTPEIIKENSNEVVLVFEPRQYQISGWFVALSGVIVFFIAGLWQVGRK